jgi:hypothetical protein
MQPMPPPPPPPPTHHGATKWVGAVVLGIAVLVALAMSNTSYSTGGSTSGSSTSDTQDMDKRVCEIARDIGGSFNVSDTLERSQERIADLYSGYGIAASPAIQAALHDWSAGMTSGDYDLAAKGITATSDACAAEGY